MNTYVQLPFVKIAPLLSIAVLSYESVQEAILTGLLSVRMAPSKNWESQSCDIPEVLFVIVILRHFSSSSLSLQNPSPKKNGAAVML